MTETDLTGSKLLSLRKSRGLTQLEMATIADCAQPTLAKWERGERKPNPRSIRLIADHFGVPVGWFWDGEDTPIPVGTKREDGNAEELPDSDLLRGMLVSVPVQTFNGCMAGNEDDDEEFVEDHDFPEVIPIYLMVGETRNQAYHTMVRINGRSLLPRIVPGNKALIFRTPTLHNRSFVLATSPEGKVYLKVLRLVDNVWQLWSTGEGSTFRDLSDWKVHGYAIAIFAEDEWGYPIIRHNDKRPLTVPDSVFEGKE